VCDALLKRGRGLPLIITLGVCFFTGQMLNRNYGVVRAKLASYGGSTPVYLGVVGDTSSRQERLT